MRDVELVNKRFWEEFTKDATHRSILIFLEESTLLKGEESIAFGEDEWKDPTIFHLLIIVLDPNNRRINTK